MSSDPFDTLPLAFAGFRLAYFLIGLLGLYALWRRPRPTGAVALLLGLNVAAWAAYVAPLGRLYALDDVRDRAFNVGMAACVAAGNSPWDHVQVGYASLEPFWDVLVAALALFDPARVMAIYHWVPVLALVVVTLGLYRGLGVAENDAWERVLMVFAVLGLSSFTASPEPPVPPLWAGNFLLKPNHATGWGVAAIVLGLRARRAPWWVQGLVLGLLAWVFLLHWAFVAAGLVLAEWLRRPEERRVKDLVFSLGVSSLVALPEILNLARDFSPFGQGDSRDQVWAMAQIGQVLALPHWVTLDLGPLFVLGIGGAVVLRRRGLDRDHLLLGLLLATWLLWLALALASPFGIAPEPDELHYFLRFAMALTAGAALAGIARHIEKVLPLGPGQGSVLVMAAFLVLTFPAYWDPPTMDRYYQWSLPPLDPKVVEYGTWVRENTPPDAVFLAGPLSSSWIPVLSGRRVLLTGDARPPSDYRERKETERLLLRSSDAEAIQRAARAAGISFLAIDRPLSRAYGLENMRPEWGA